MQGYNKFDHPELKSKLPQKKQYYYLIKPRNKTIINFLTAHSFYT
jgi:hypothetical protein